MNSDRVTNYLRVLDYYLIDDIRNNLSDNQLLLK